MPDASALAPQKRGPKADPGRADALQIAQLTRDNDKLQGRLDKALLVIEVQFIERKLVSDTSDNRLGVRAADGSLVKDSG